MPIRSTADLESKLFSFFTDVNGVSSDNSYLDHVCHHPKTQKFAVNEGITDERSCT